MTDKIHARTSITPSLLRCAIHLFVVVFLCISFLLIPTMITGFAPMRHGDVPFGRKTIIYGYPDAPPAAGYELKTELAIWWAERPLFRLCILLVAWGAFWAADISAPRWRSTVLWSVLWAGLFYQMLNWAVFLAEWA